MTIINKIYGIDVDSRRSVSGPKRGDGFAVEKVHHQDLNQLLFELGSDHIIGSQSQVTGLTATIYYDSATTSFKDKNGAAPTILDGDKVAWRGLDTITANIDLSAYDDIEHIMFQGITIDLGTYDLDLGENQRGELDLTGSGTVTILSSDGLRIKHSGLTIDNQAGDIIINNIINGGRAIDFTPKNMKINVTGVDDLTIKADGIQYVNASGETKEELVPFVAVWHPSTDIIGGEAGTNSQWLQAWRNYIGVMKLTLCEEGTATGTSAGFLVAASNTLFTRGAVQGDYLFNTATFQKTKISTTPTADNDPVEVDDDIFVSGNGYKLIKNTAPSVLGEFVACLGFGKQDSGSDLVDCGYTRPELQEFPMYAGDHTGNKEFTIGEATTAVTSTLIANAKLLQELDFLDTPQWLIEYEISYTIFSASRVNSQLTITGVQYKTGADQVITSYMQASYSQPPINAEAQSGSNIAIMRHNSATTAQYGFSSNGKYLDYKPSWGTRS